MENKKEIDPNGLPSHKAGAKLDEGKICASVLEDMGLALLFVAKVGTGGRYKYSRGGWQFVKNGITRYKDALWRHLLKSRYSSIDPDFGLSHIAHLAWNTLALLELQIREILGDDINDPEKIEQLMSELTPQIQELIHRHD